MTDQKQSENVEYGNYLGSLTTNGPICASEIKTRIAITKAPFNMKRPFSSAH
jgi:hypothetical protein